MTSGLTWDFVAEREGFEPPGRLHARLLFKDSAGLTLTLAFLVRVLIASLVGDR
jgi:hypothetical protein